MDVIPLIISGAATAAAAVWALRSKLSDLEKALAVDVSGNAQEHAHFEARLTRLERRIR